MKSKEIKEIIKNSDKFNPGKDVWEKIKSSSEPAYSSEIIENERCNVKPRKRVFAAAALICAAAVTIGIFSFALPAKAQSTDLMKGIKKSDDIETSAELSNNFVKSASNFSIELFKNAANNSDSKENILISPTSSYLALGLILNGTDGETKKVMESTLAKYGLYNNELNRNYKTLIGKLTESNGDTKLSISNSIWFDKGFNADKSFLQNNADYFDAGAYTLNFRDKNAVNNINSWVKKNTNKLIEKIVDNIPNDAVMYLTNTVYFKAKWETPFNAHDTYEDDFKGENGATKAKYMSKSGELNYIQTQNEQAVLLPYNDGKYSFLAMLPKDNMNIRKYLNSFDDNKIKNTIKEMKRGEVRLKLPKFSVSYNIEMNNVLKQMGLSNIFSQKEANFSKMGTASQGNIYVSKINQKTIIKVGEKGTEAASAVIMGIGATSGPPQPIFINFNHPFIYAIVDNRTELPIFIGIMENPTSN